MKSVKEIWVDGVRFIPARRKMVQKKKKPADNVLLPKKRNWRKIFRHLKKIADLARLIC